MKRFALLVLFLFALMLAAPAVGLVPSAVEGQTKPAAQDEYVPVANPVSPDDVMPAPRLVAIAYGFIWVVLFGYVWSIKSRLTRVEREMETVSRRIPARK